jgi:hypothetical protein
MDGYETNHELLHAICESTESRDDQIKLLNQLLDVTVRMRDIAQSQKEGALGTALPVSMSDAFILAIKIEQEKLTPAK